MIYAAAFGASFVFIFLKAFQQLNVVRGAYLWVLPVSLAMAAMEVYVITVAAGNGWGWIVLPIGFGSALGAMAAMVCHGRFVVRR